MAQVNSETKKKLEQDTTTLPLYQDEVNKEDREVDQYSEVIQELCNKLISDHFFGSTNIPEQAQVTGYLNCFFRKISFQAMSLLQPISTDINILDEMIMELASFIETGIANCVEQASFWVISIIQKYQETGDPDFLPANVVFSDKEGKLLHRYAIIAANRNKDNSIAKDFFKPETVALDTWLDEISDAIDHAERVPHHFPDTDNFVVYDMLKHKHEFHTIQERVAKARANFSRAFQLCLNSASLIDSEFPLDIDKGKKHLLACLDQATKEKNEDKIRRIRRYLDFLDLSPSPPPPLQFSKRKRDKTEQDEITPIKPSKDYKKGT